MSSVRGAIPPMVAAALLVAALTGCIGGSGSGSGSDGADSGNPGSSTGPSPGASESGDGDGDDESGEPGTATDDGVVQDPAAASPQDQTDAVAAAEALVRDFARPDLDADSWLAALTPRLSPGGLEAYLGTDPSAIPARAVTGAGELQSGSTALTAIVRVPTDAGAYDVSLSRPDAATPWRGDRIRPVGG